ncbi:uncharacterized protein LOC134803533 [Cydia splendana]|uniref:uncharacterized protein LOC134803533 n=1 Tax=Cydia splendana TaxID=1100963 RepID=UPI00300D2919
MDGSKSRKSDAAATRKRRSSILKSQRNVRAPLSELEFNVATPDQAKSRRVSFSRRTGVAEFEISEATTAWKNVYEEHNKSLESSANESGIKAAPRRVGHLGARASQFEDEEADVIDTTETQDPPSAQLDELPTNTNTIQADVIDTTETQDPPSAQLDELPTNTNTIQADVIDTSETQDPPSAQLDELPTNTNTIQADVIDTTETQDPPSAQLDELPTNTNTIQADVIDTTETQDPPSAQLDELPTNTNTIQADVIDTTETQDPPSAQLDELPTNTNTIQVTPHEAPRVRHSRGRCYTTETQDPPSAQLDELPTNTNTIQADVIDTTETQDPPSAQLDELPTNTNTIQLFRLESNPGHRELTDNLDVDFSAMAPLADDLEALRQDLEREPKRANISEVSIDLDFNSTHFSLKADEDDMSITDTVRSPAVAATKKQVEDWTVDKENIVINPYIAPPPAEFPCEDDILVFDGKKCKFQSKLDLSDTPLEAVGENIPPKTVVDDMTQAIPVVQANIHDKSVLNTERGRTVVFGDDGDMSVTRGVANNIIAAKGVLEDKENQKTMYFNDLPDMSVTQALPADIIQNEPQLKTILYEDDAHISMTEAVPGRVLARPENLAPEAKLENKRRTIVYENADVSMTLVVSGGIQEIKGSEDRRKTIVFGNDDGNVSVTGVLPANIIDEVKIQSNMEQRKTIGFVDKDGHVSMTGVLPSNIIDEAKLVPPPNMERRKTIVYGNDNGNLSVTGVLPTNIIDEAKLTQLNTGRRRTVVFGNDDGNLSMTGVAPANILNGAKVQQPIERRKTIVYDNDDGNVSITSAIPANIIDAPKAIQQCMDRRKTVVFGNDDGNLSMTGVAPINVLDGAKDPNEERRKTIVYENDGGNISMTGVVPVNILDGAKEIQDINTDRRKTIVYENDGGNISMTGVVPVNILDGAKEMNTDRRKIIVYENDGGNISMTGVVPVNILDGAKETQEINTDRRKTIVYNNDNGNISVTGVVPVNIFDVAKETQQPNADRRKTIVYDNDQGNISLTGVVPVNILDEAKQLPTDRRETGKIVDDGNVPNTGVLTNILDDGAKVQPLNAIRRITVVYDRDNGNLSKTGVAPINILDGANKQTQHKTVYVTDNGNLPLTAAASENLEVANEPNTERGKTVFDDDDNYVSVTGIIPANIIEEEAKLIQSLNEERSKTIVYGNEDGNLSATGVTPENIIDKESDKQQPETNRKSVYGVKDGNMSVIGILLANMLDQEEGNIITQPSNADNKKTVVYEEVDANMSITGVIPNIIDEAKSTHTPNERRITIVYEGSDVSMTDIVPANIMPEDTNIVVPETHTSIICENTETQQNELEVFDEKDEQVEMIEAVTIPKLIESDEEGDVSMTQADGPQSPKNLCSATFNKSLANQDITSVNKSLAGQKKFAIDNTSADQTFDKSVDPHSATINKSLAGQVSTALEKSANQEQTFNKSLADQVLSTTFNKNSADVTTAEKSQVDPHSATFNKYLANQELATTKSLAGQESATLNKSVAGQDSTINKTLTAPSMSMNKTLTSNVLVYGATTEREAKGSDNSYIVGLNLEDNQSEESPNASLALSKSSAEQLARSREEAVMTPPKGSVLDVLLDMSQASGEDMWNKPQSNTVTEPVSNITVTATDTVSTYESYILVKDDEPDEPALEVTQPLAIEYKKQKHGIVCNLQRKLSELKDMLHVRPKSPKKNKNKSETQDLTHNTPKLDTPKTTDSFEKSKLPKPSLNSTSSNLDTPKINESFEKSKMPKPSLKLKAFKSPSSPNNVQEKNKSVSIDLASEMFIHDDEESVVDNQIQVDLTSNEDKEQADTTRYQANDTKAILDALSDFTDTRRSGDFEPAQDQNKTKRSSAPDRKSMVISREDLFRGISMAQALMKTEMAQTEIELDATEGSSDDQEPSPPRLSGEVVKTLRFDDDDSILESKILQKPVSTDSPPIRTSSVIPTYEISDPVKELMKELIKPLADVEQPSPSRPCQSSQANHLDSSQIDLIPAKPISSPRSCLTRNEKEVAHSETHVESPRREPGPVIVFDPSNPLNNVVIPPVDQAVVHKYNPIQSAHSISPSIRSIESQCCQTEAPGPRNMDVGMVLVRSTVDRGVASSLMLGGVAVDRAVATNPAVKDCEVNTSIVMKGNRELLADSSSLTLVDDALPRSPVRVIFSLDEPYSSVMLDSDLSSVYDSSELGRKRGHVAAKGPEVTPKPAMKVQKVSRNTKVSRGPRSQSPKGKEASVSRTSSSKGSTVTVAQLYACARSATSASATDSRCSRDWRPELLHEASSKNLVAEQESSVNVVAKIDVLPFMGTYECEWESRAADTWSFRLLRARLRLLIRLEHRATNTTRVLVRADTPVRLVTVQHATVDQGRIDMYQRLRLLIRLEHRATNTTRVLVRADTPVRLVTVQHATVDQGRIDMYQRLRLLIRLEHRATNTTRVLVRADMPVRLVTVQHATVDQGRIDMYQRLRLLIRLEHRATNTTRVLVRADTPVRLVTVQHATVDQGRIDMYQRLRRLIRLEHRATNTTRVLVRADTPVRLVTVQHATVDQERTEPVAALCLCLAAEALQRICARGVARAGAVPALLRRAAAIARVSTASIECSLHTSERTEPVAALCLCLAAEALQRICARGVARAGAVPALLRRAAAIARVSTASIECSLHTSERTEPVAALCLCLAAEALQRICARGVARAGAVPALLRRAAAIARVSTASIECSLHTSERTEPVAALCLCLAAEALQRICARGVARAGAVPALLRRAAAIARVSTASIECSLHTSERTEPVAALCLCLAAEALQRICARGVARAGAVPALLRRAAAIARVSTASIECSLHTSERTEPVAALCLCLAAEALQRICARGVARAGAVPALLRRAAAIARVSTASIECSLHTSERTEPVAALCLCLAAEALQRICARGVARAGAVPALLRRAAAIARVSTASIECSLHTSERTEPVAALCLCLAAEALQRICARGVARAGAVPALLRRAAAIARVALHWGRCMRQASAALAFSLSEDGRLSLKVANIPLRSIWEVTLVVELADDGRGTPHPRAAGVAVTAVLAARAVTAAELRPLLAAVPEDWGHVPRTIWKVFKYLKNKRPEDDLFVV